MTAKVDARFEGVRLTPKFMWQEWRTDWLALGGSVGGSVKPRAHSVNIFTSSCISSREAEV